MLLVLGFMVFYFMCGRIGVLSLVMVFGYLLRFVVL